MRDLQGERTSLFYDLANVFTKAMLNTFSRWRIVGIERVPLRGPLLVVSNHQNGADPPMLVAIIPRVVHFMAKQEIFDGPLYPLARWYGSFPVKRGKPDRR